VRTTLSLVIECGHGHLVLVFAVVVPGRVARVWPRSWGQGRPREGRGWPASWPPRAAAARCRGCSRRRVDLPTASALPTARDCPLCLVLPRRCSATVISSHCAVVTHLVASACEFAPSAALHATLPLRALRSHTPRYLRRCAPRQGRSRPVPSTVVLPPPVSLAASALPCLPRPAFYLLARPRVVPAISRTPVEGSRWRTRGGVNSPF
jgi:hypothetical protein